jgi:hypothetical protein
VTVNILKNSRNRTVTIRNKNWTLEGITRIRPIPARKIPDVSILLRSCEDFHVTPEILAHTHAHNQQSKLTTNRHNTTNITHYFTMIHNVIADVKTSQSHYYQFQVFPNILHRNRPGNTPKYLSNSVPSTWGIWKTHSFTFVKKDS